MQPISNRPGGSSRVPGLDHRDQPVAGKRVAGHRPVARLENVQGELAAREEQGAGEREDGHAKERAFASAEQDRREAAALRAGPGILEPDRLEDLQQPLARRALVPLAVAGDAFEQLVGGGVAVAGGDQRAGKVDPRLMIVGIGGDPRLELGRVAGRRRLGQRQRRAGAGDRRVLRRPSRADSRASRAPRRSARRRSARGRGRRSPRDAPAPSRRSAGRCWRRARHRPRPAPARPSRSAARSRPRAACASPWTGSCARIWSSAAGQLAFGARRRRDRRPAGPGRSRRRSGSTGCGTGPRSISPRRH